MAKQTNTPAKAVEQNEAPVINMPATATEATAAPSAETPAAPAEVTSPKLLEIRAKLAIAENDLSEAEDTYFAAKKANGGKADRSGIATAENAILKIRGEEKAEISAIEFVAKMAKIAEARGKRLAIEQDYTQALLASHDFDNTLPEVGARTAEQLAKMVELDTATKNAKDMLHNALLGGVSAPKTTGIKPASTNGTRGGIKSDVEAFVAQCIANGITGKQAINSAAKAEGGWNTSDNPAGRFNDGTFGNYAKAYAESIGAAW